MHNDSWKSAFTPILHYNKYYGLIMQCDILHVGSGPEELTISYDRDNRHFCVYYPSASDPKYPIRYQASISTDHDSDHNIIWTSEEMLTPQCIDIPVELHHNILCSPFNLTLYLMDSFEEEIQTKQLEISKSTI